MEIYTLNQVNNSLLSELKQLKQEMKQWPQAPIIVPQTASAQPAKLRAKQKAAALKKQRLLAARASNARLRPERKAAKEREEQKRANDIKLQAQRRKAKK
eukprot:GILI01061607.1.p1 GENE.GILI01061607.1~~GILI01061607.1.p1  ORF type:complete len:100 (-),score=16.39 GILI01061607.1:51-350(-)